MSLLQQIILWMISLVWPIVSDVILFSCSSNLGQLLAPVTITEEITDSKWSKKVAKQCFLPFCTITYQIHYGRQETTITVITIASGESQIKLDKKEKGHAKQLKQIDKLYHCTNYFIFFFYWEWFFLLFTAQLNPNIGKIWFNLMWDGGIFSP